MQNYYLCLLFLLISNFNCLSAQECYLSLEEILAYTSQKKFAVHSLYKVVANRVSDDEKIEVTIEGAISDPDFSFALISMLPALQEVKRGWSLKFRYYRTNDKDFDEAKVIDAIRHLYPEKLLEYLVARAEESFSKEWKQVVVFMQLDIKVIIDFMTKVENAERVLRSFDSEISYDAYRVIVNGRNIVLIKDFYKELLGSRILAAPEPYYKCVTGCLGSWTNRFINERVWEEGDSTGIVTIYRRDPNEMYFELLYCLNDSNILAWLGEEEGKPGTFKNWAIDRVQSQCLGGNPSGLMKRAKEICRERIENNTQAEYPISWGNIVN